MTGEEKIAAVQMLLRYVQPLPDDGYFCRSVVRAAVDELINDGGNCEVPMLVWAQVRSDIPDCYPGENCC